ncbi:MAG: hypothetical protein K2K84_01075 [Muribaculaceae bacterium]|nr:hypothetical protein [Muribaculaceae bacterium]
MKRRISYQWRLFIPVVATLWITLLSLAAWQYHRERDYRRTFVNGQLDIVTKRVIATLNLHSTAALKEYLEYIDKYFIDNELFEGIRISIYDTKWNVTDSVGPAIILTPEEQEQVTNDILDQERTSKYPDKNLVKKKFLYHGEQTDDEQLRVITALPMDTDLEKYLAGDSTEVWITVFALALVMTVLC